MGWLSYQRYLSMTVVDRLTVACVCVLSAALVSAQPAPAEIDNENELVLDGVIVAASPGDSIALVRPGPGKRARAVRVGQAYRGYVLVEVSRNSAWFEGVYGGLRVTIGEQVKPVVPVALSSPPEAKPEVSWVRRTFSRAEANQRLEKEIPVILADTEVTPRVVEGEVRGLQLLRLPDGTVLSRSGLLPGDVLKSINEEPLRGLDSLWKLLARFADEDELRVVLERRGDVVRLAYDLVD